MEACIFFFLPLPATRKFFFQKNGKKIFLSKIKIQNYLSFSYGVLLASSLKIYRFNPIFKKNFFKGGKIFLKGEIFFPLGSPSYPRGKKNFKGEFFFPLGLRPTQGGKIFSRGNFFSPFKKILIEDEIGHDIFLKRKQVGHHS